MKISFRFKILYKEKVNSLIFSVEKTLLFTAGVPIEAQQNLEAYIYISHRPAEEYFALRVHGDSMKNVGIFDKSVLVCHKQEVAENGEIVVAMLNGEQTVKRYKVHGNNIFLMPENPDYLPRPVTPTDELLILGKVVEIRVML